MERIEMGTVSHLHVHKRSFSEYALNISLTKRIGVKSYLQKMFEKKSPLARSDQSKKSQYSRSEGFRMGAVPVVREVEKSLDSSNLRFIPPLSFFSLTSYAPATLTLLSSYFQMYGALFLFFKLWTKFPPLQEDFPRAIASFSFVLQPKSISFLSGKSTFPEKKSLP